MRRAANKISCRSLIRLFISIRRKWMQWTRSRRRFGRTSRDVTADHRDKHLFCLSGSAVHVTCFSVVFQVVQGPIARRNSSCTHPSHAAMLSPALAIASLRSRSRKLGSTYAHPTPGPGLALASMCVRVTRTTGGIGGSSVTTVTPREYRPGPGPGMHPYGCIHTNDQA
jgi:hypothetical protein